MISVNVRAVLGITAILRDGVAHLYLGAAWPAVHTKQHLIVDMPESKNRRINRDERRLLFKDMWPDSITK